MDLVEVSQLLGNFGEFVGAIAVVVTLIYLAAQVKQNTRVVRSAAYQSSGDQMSRHALLITQNPEYAAVYHKAYTEPESLDDVEYLRVSHHLYSLMHAFETLYLCAEEGTLPRSLWLAEEQALRGLVAQPLIARWWDSDPVVFTTEFRSLIEGLRSQEQGVDATSGIRSPWT